MNIWSDSTFQRTFTSLVVLWGEIYSYILTPSIKQFIIEYQKKNQENCSKKKARTLPRYKVFNLEGHKPSTSNVLNNHREEIHSNCRKLHQRKMINMHVWGKVLSSVVYMSGWDKDRLHQQFQLKAGSFHGWYPIYVNCASCLHTSA